VVRSSGVRVAGVAGAWGAIAMVLAPSPPRVHTIREPFTRAVNAAVNT
jgi:hypothetical protein